MSSTDDDSMEYDFSKLGKAVRGKFFDRVPRETNVVPIEPDLLKAFPTAKAINDALREVLERRAGSTSPTQRG
jgi:hypothetical protein